MRRVRLFVYGSLKAGSRHHDQMAGAVYEGAARTRDGFALFSMGSYPALAHSAGGCVYGEIYWVTEDHLRDLDQFEGCPSLYQRATIELSDASVAFAYTIAAERVKGRRQIGGGCWEEA